MIIETQDYSKARVGEMVTINGSSHKVLGNEPKLKYLHLSVGTLPTLVLYRVLEAAGAVIRREVRLPTADGSVVSLRGFRVVRVAGEWINSASGRRVPDDDWQGCTWTVLFDANPRKS